MLSSMSLAAVTEQAHCEPAIRPNPRRKRPRFQHIERENSRARAKERRVQSSEISKLMSGIAMLKLRNGHALM